jgi:hypothetical protein
LAIAAILLLLLVAYAFGWATSYRKTRARISDLELRIDTAETEKLAKQI